MKYLCLIYEDESTWGKMPKQEADTMRGGYHAFTQDIFHDRWSLCRNQGTARRVLPHRGQGPERRHPGGRADSGPAAGLELIDGILLRGELADYHLAHSARADLCRRLGKSTEAIASYQRALALTRQEPERRFLERRLRN